MTPYVDVLQAITPPLVLISVTLCATVGLLAILRPALLESANAKSSRWIDSRKLFELLDRQVHVDQMILKHNKVFGVLSILTAIGLTVWYFNVR